MRQSPKHNADFTLYEEPEPVKVRKVRKKHKRSKLPEEKLLAQVNFSLSSIDYARLQAASRESRVPLPLWVRLLVIDALDQIDEEGTP